MDFSKRANLLGTVERRGVLDVCADAPGGFVGADWMPMTQLRADDGEGDVWNFHGEASVVDTPYTVTDMFGDYTEQIISGAFDKTLSERPDVSLVYMHDFATTMATTRAHTLTLRADPNLTTEAPLAKSDLDAQRVVPKIQRGDANAMSFRFRVKRQEWNEDYTDRKILEVSLHRGDVSIVVTGLGANPAAWGDLRDGLDFEQVLRFLDGATLDDEARSRLTAALRAEPEAPDPVDDDAVREYLGRRLALIARREAESLTLPA